MPIQLLVLGAALREEGLGATVFTLCPDLHKSVAGLAATGCKVFGFSSICTTLPIALVVARELKKKLPDSTIIFGGAQPSLVHNRLADEYNFIDAIVVGEGDVALPKIVKDFPLKNKIFKSPLIADLNTLPYPDTDLIKIEDYLHGEISFPLDAGRGCPCSCTYCSTKIVWRKKFRVKSPTRILGEMEFIFKKTGIKKFDLTHDYFTYSAKYLSDFCDYLAKNNKNKLAWSASSRLDCLDEEIIGRMAEAGCSGLFFGIESGSEKIQNAIKKKLKLPNYENIIGACAKHGIAADASFILGFPEENVGDINKTLSLMLKIRRLGANVIVSKLSPLAGTPYLDLFKDNLIESSYTPLGAELPFDSEDAALEIKTHPDIFSCFYSVPHPSLSDAYISGLCFFYFVAVRDFSESLTAIFDSTNLTCTELFDQWAKWMDKKHPSAKFDEAFIHANFFDFVKHLLRPT